MILFILLMNVFFCYADQGLFDLAHSLYAQGAYEAALAEYQKIPNKTGAVWYNMANAAYRQRDDTHALLYMLRAQKFGDAQTYAAAYEKMNEITSSVGLSRQGYKEITLHYLTLFNKKVPLYIWQIIVLLVWYLICYVLMKKHRVSLLQILFSCLLMILMLAPIVAGYYNDRQNVLVIAESVDVFNGPNTALYKIGAFKKNTLAQLLQVKKQWYKISHDGIIGWIERAAAAKI